MAHPRFEVYPEAVQIQVAADGAGEAIQSALQALPPPSWRWRLVGGNGEKIAMGTEAYTSRNHACRALDDVARIVMDGVDVVTCE